MNSTDPHQYLPLLDKIYPGPRRWVESAWGTERLKFCHFYPKKDNNGIACLIEQDGSLVGYMAFDQDMLDDFRLAWLRRELSPYLHSPTPSLFFNVYGRNSDAIRAIQSMGFRLEMQGIKLQYFGPLPPEYHPQSLVLREFADDQLQLFIDLFDKAYEPLYCNVNMPLNGWFCSPDTVLRNLKSYKSADGLFAYWQRERLVGVCLARPDGYINDLAVHPAFQNNGFGRIILLNTVRTLILRKLDCIHLDVTIENTAAQRFFLRHGFQEVGCFADHTYLPLY